MASLEREISAMKRLPSCLFLVSALLAPDFAGPAEERPVDSQVLTLLEERANAAPDREQCYRYAELVHEMVRYSAAQYTAGDVENAHATLKRAQGLATKLRGKISSNVKRLKPAQILLRRAAFRLTDLLHVTHAEDRELVQETLVEVESAERDALKQVLR